MAINAGEIYWSKIENSFKAYPPLNSDITTQVVIVGGGIYGCLTCYYLSKYNIDTILIDEDSIAHGNTLLKTFTLQQGAYNMLTDLTYYIPEENAIRLYRLSQKAIDEIEHILWDLGKLCGFQKKDSLIFTDDAYTYMKLQHEYEYRTQLGIKCSLLDEYSLFNNYSISGKGAILTSGSAQINPFKFCHALIKASLLKGCQVYENTPLINFEYIPDNKIKLNTQNHSIICDKIVFTSGSSVNHLLKQDLTKKREFSVIVTSPLPQENNPLSSCITNHFNSTDLIVRTTEDGRIMSELIAPLSASSNSSPSLVSEEESFNKLLSKFPFYENLKIDFYWNGSFADTKTKLPFVGLYHRFPNCYFNLGYGMNAEIYSIIAANIIKDLILYDSSPDSALFSFEQ